MPENEDRRKTIVKESSAEKNLESLKMKNKIYFFEDSSLIAWHQFRHLDCRRDRPDV
jgi:hypothetical protein